MSLGKLRNVLKIDLPMLPEGAAGVAFWYEVDPPEASMMVYRAPGDMEPTELQGPAGYAAIPLVGPEIYVQRIRGATGFKKITVIGYSDDPDDFTSPERRQKFLDQIVQRYGHQPPE